MFDLVDIGANLCDKSFASDLDEVMASALESGVRRMVVTGTTAERSRAGIDLCARFPDRLWTTAGVHPHHASEYTQDTTRALRELASQNKVVAIGECGLDYNRNYSSPEAQRKAFAAQLALAVELQLPLFLHERDALADQIAMLREHRAEIPKAVLHCFTGEAEALQRLPRSRSLHRDYRLDL